MLERRRAPGLGIYRWSSRPRRVLRTRYRPPHSISAAEMEGLGVSAPAQKVYVPFLSPFVGHTNPFPDPFGRLQQQACRSA